MKAVEEKGVEKRGNEVLGEELTRALEKIVKGSGAILAGTLLAMLLNFFSRVILARAFTVSEYGVFNLAVTILGFASIFSLMGLHEYIPREIPYYKVKDPSRVREIISTSITLALVGGIAGGVALYLASDPLARFFHEPRLSYALKILSISLPFQALLTMSISVFRGFERVRENVYFQNIIRPSLWLGSLLVIYMLKLPLIYVFWFFVLVYFVTFIALLLYSKRFNLVELDPLYINPNIARRLLAFSLPLLFTGVMGFIMNWTDTLMIGYFKGSRLVGIYNAAVPLARLLTIFLGVAGFLYVPIISEFYAKSLTYEFKKIYQIITKWVFILTLPIFVAYVLYPRTIISLLFGIKYQGGFLSLQILSIGFIFHVMLGLNGLSLVVLGETKFIALYSLLAASINFILNTILIPFYGIKGAASATSISYIIANILASTKLYLRCKITPIDRSYLKVLIEGLGLLAIFKLLNYKGMQSYVFLIAYILIFVILIIASKGVRGKEISVMLKGVYR